MNINSPLLESPDAPPAVSEQNGFLNGHSTNGSATNGSAANGSAASYSNGFAPAAAPANAAGVNALPANPQSEQEGIDPRQVLSMLRRRRRLMIAALALTVAGGTLLTLLAKPVYQSTATLLVNTTASRDSSASDLPLLADLIGATKARSQETQIEILKSTPVKEGALGRLPESERQAIKEFSTTNITPVRDTDVIAVNVTSRNAQAARDYAQALCDEYIEEMLQQNQQQVLTATRYVSSQLPSVRRELNQARDRLRRFKESNGTTNLDAETQARITQLGQVQSDLRQAQAERDGNIAQVQAMRAMAAKMASSEVRPDKIVRRPAVEELKAQLTKLELSRLEAIQDLSPNNSRVRNIQGQIDSLKKRLTGEAATEVGSWSNDPNPIRLQTLSDASRAQGQVWAQEARVRALTAATSQARAQLTKLPAQEAQLGQLTTEMATLQQTYQMLNEKYQNLRVSEEARVASARVVSPSELPDAPISPNKPRNILLSLVMGTMLAFALASLAERLDDRVHSESDAETASGLPVLAHIPFIKDKEKQSLLGNTDNNSMLLESYRMLRTNIEFASIDRPIRSVVITSSQPNEGKSTTSTDLAIVMALDGKKVVLVDVDLRRPSIHRLMNLPNKVGFTNVVAGKASLKEALQATSIPGLAVLTSGPVPLNPPELLNSQSSRDLLRKLAEAADFVVIDTPPALVMADAQIAASCADASLLVISMAEAGRREIARTSNLLSQTGTKVLGTVLNKLTSENSGYYGYSGYKGYNKYYGEYVNENAK